MGIIGKVGRYTKEHGVGGLVKRVVLGSNASPTQNANPPLENPLNRLESYFDIAHTPFNSADYQSQQNARQQIINWIISEPFAGSGGHINIFRFVSFLEERGFHNKIYCYNSAFTSDDEAQTFCENNFELFDARIEVFHNLDSMGFAHASIATHWITAYPLRSFDNTLAKFYFIQDFEPYFYSRGSEYALAELTYTFGFRGITAGGWIKELVEANYGMTAESFDFSYDKELYKPFVKNDERKRIFFYARPSTPRRNFEMGLYVLTKLSERLPELEVLFAGADLSNYAIRIPHYRSLGILAVEDLAAVYSQCDICLVFSYTNLSLLPLEVMASGSVVASSRGAHNEWLLNKENAILLSDDPEEMVDSLEHYLTHEDTLRSLREAGLSFAQSSSWEKEGNKVHGAICAGIAAGEAELAL